ncbi:MAG: ABC transporter permease [Spirochaetales bacterium]|jgi:ribose transport system permease protein|nr:ABC transporter permease [Spirochaetales bacterium]
MKSTFKSILNKIRTQDNSEVTLLIALFLIGLVFTILSPYFLTIKNFLNIGIYSAIIGVTATTTTLALIQGCIDISVGSIMALTGMICAILLKSGASMFVAIVIAFAAGVAGGAFNGLMVSKAKINPMITTLSTMTIFRGIAYLSNDGISIVINNNSFKWMGRGYIGPIPFIIILMLIAYFAMWYIAKYTAFGRRIYATGSNPRASYLSGINTSRMIFVVYILNGMMAGISGILMAAQSGAGLPIAGEGYEMTIISACILGGTSLSGGKGSIWGTFIGVIMLTTIANGLTMLAVQTFWQHIIKGIILLVSVLIDSIRSGALKKV